MTMWIILGIIALGIVLYFLVSVTNKVTNQQFTRQLIQDIARYFAERTNVSETVLMDDVKKLLDKKKTRHLPNILRMECSVDMLDANTCSRTLTIYIQKENDVQQTTLTRNISRDDLPSAIRMELLRTGTGPVRFDLLK